MILTKEQFVYYVNTLKKFNKMDTDLGNSFGINLEFMTDEIVGAYTELLGIAAGGTKENNIINWWLYETNIDHQWGIEPKIYDLDGTVVCSLDTPEDLYDYLAQMHAE